MKGMYVLSVLYLHLFLKVILSLPFVALDSVYTLLTSKYIAPAQTCLPNSRLIYVIAY